ncbi:protein of unknown function (plasmid) [Methylocella tundrae]|uniref:Uncharacterized protein n=1 Tax=Methylocella tundrae TaxID=227605 RepID=A0A4V6INC9_METTU|nr:protein of unknown function [Methylocella tundrae]
MFLKASRRRRKRAASVEPPPVRQIKLADIHADHARSEMPDRAEFGRGRTVPQRAPAKRLHTQKFHVRERPHYGDRQRHPFPPHRVAIKRPQIRPDLLRNIDHRHPRIASPNQYDPVQLLRLPDDARNRAVVRRRSPREMPDQRTALHSKSPSNRWP